MIEFMLSSGFIAVVELLIRLEMSEIFFFVSVSIDALICRKLGICLICTCTHHTWLILSSHIQTGA